jgi:hypothetical protein
LSASDFGVNVKERAKRYWTEDPSVSPDEMAQDYEDQYGSAKMALSGTFDVIRVLIIAAKQMLAEEIFNDPNVRKYFRELLLGTKSRPSRVGWAVKPTESGMKKIDESHPYYVFLI